MDCECGAFLSFVFLLAFGGALFDVESVVELSADYFLNRRQMVLSRFWFGFYGVKLSMLAELAFARRIKLTYEPQSPASTCSRVLAGPP